MPLFYTRQTSEFAEGYDMEGRFKIARVIFVAWCWGLSFSGLAAISGDGVAQTCVACHGSDGNSLVPAWPKLAGQHATYLYRQLQYYQEGEKGPRYVPAMLSVVADLSDQDLWAISQFYAGQRMSPGYAQPKNLDLAQRLYRGGDRSRGIAACMACHGPKGEGNGQALSPRLSGQHADYIRDQLLAYRENKRTTDPQGIMRTLAKKLTIEEIGALANYVQGLY